MGSSSKISQSTLCEKQESNSRYQGIFCIEKNIVKLQYLRKVNLAAGSHKIYFMKKWSQSPRSYEVSCVKELSQAATFR